MRRYGVKEWCDRTGFSLKMVGLSSSVTSLLFRVWRVALEHYVPLIVLYGQCRRSFLSRVPWNWEGDQLDRED